MSATESHTLFHPQTKKIDCQISLFCDSGETGGPFKFLFHTYSDHFAVSHRQADEAYHIGPAASQLSYLDKDKVIQVAKHSGAQVSLPFQSFMR